MMPLYRQTREISVLLALMVIVLLSVSFVSNHTPGSAFDLQFGLSGLMLIVVALFFRFLIKKVTPLHKAAYRIAVVMAIWAFGLYVFPYPRLAIYLITAPGFYFLLRIEVKGEKRQKEDLIAAGALLSLGVFLYIFQQPMYMVLFPEQSFAPDFYRNQFYSNAPLMLLVGPGLMRLRRHIHWPGLSVLGAALFIMAAVISIANFSFGIGFKRYLFTFAEAVIFVVLAHTCLYILFFRKSVLERIAIFSGIPADEQKRFRLALYLLLNLALQVTLIYTATYLKFAQLTDSEIIAGPALMLLVVLAPAYGYRIYSMAPLLVELAVLGYPLGVWLSPDLARFFLIPPALALLAAGWARSFGQVQYLRLASAAGACATLYYLHLLINIDFLNIYGLAGLLWPLAVYAYWPQKPQIVPVKYHWFFWPIFAAVSILCLNHGYSRLVPPVLALATIAVPFTILSLAGTARLRGLIIKNNPSAIKAWNDQRRFSLLSLSFVSLGIGAAGFVTHPSWYMTAWPGVALLLATIFLGIVIFMAYTIQTGQHNYAAVTESLIWLFMLLGRWKLDVDHYFEFGSPIDGYLIVGMAILAAGLREIVRARAPGFSAYVQRSVILYALAGFFYIMAAPFGAGTKWYAAYHSEVIAAITAALFFWVSRSGQRWVLTLAFVMGNAAILLFFNRREAVNPLFYLTPTISSMLILLHVFKDQLSTRQMSTARLFCGLILFGVSTFNNIVDFNESIWYSVTAALFSTIAVIAGISLRIRIYLYLGTSFFFVNLFAVVAHFVVAQPPEYLKLYIGIIFLFTGIAFTASFLLFQIKREEIIARYKFLLQEFSTWE